MSCKIPIPSPKDNIRSSKGSLKSHPTHHPTLSTYCYIKADEDHYDLQDLFGGKYIKAQEIWRFPKNLEQQVYNFLDCSSTESEESDDYINTKSKTSLQHSNPRLGTCSPYHFELQSDSDDSAWVVGDSKGSTEEDKVIPNKKRRDRLHRANSFNASDDSNDECDSLDENFRRRRQPIEKVLVESNKLKKEADKIN